MVKINKNTDIFFFLYQFEIVDNPICLNYTYFIKSGSNIIGVSVQVLRNEDNNGHYSLDKVKVAQ